MSARRTDRIETDDEVYDVRMVYLGPDDKTMPIEARYLTWGLVLLMTGTWWALDRFVLFGQLGWAVYLLGPISAALTMNIVDHERPLGAHLEATAREAARVVRRQRPGAPAVDVSMRVSVVRPVTATAAPEPAVVVTETPEAEETVKQSRPPRQPRRPRTPPPSNRRRRISTDG